MNKRIDGTYSFSLVIILFYTGDEIQFMIAGGKKNTRNKSRKAPPGLRKIYLSGAILLVLVFAAYYPALRAGFVWDDDALTQNPLMLNLDGLKKIWFEPSLIPREAHYWPLVYTSFWIEYHIWHLFPMGFHFVNILIHGLNAILLWMILKRLSVKGAWIISAVFALHPVHAESVAWIIERKDVLSGLFYLLCFLYFIQFAENKKNSFYILSLGFFLCALLSKSIVVSLPVILILYLWWKGTGISKKEILWILPFFILAIGLTLFDLWLFRQRTSASFDLTIPGRIIIAGKALWYYAFKVIYPFDFMAIHPRWKINAGNPLLYLYPLGAIIVPIVLYVLRKKTGRSPLFLVLFFGITLLPVLGFIDYGFMQYSFVADRFQYLAGIGLIVLVMSFLMFLWDKTGKNGIYMKYAGSGALLFFLGILTWNQARTYKDYETLFQHNVKKNPDSWAAHNNLAAALENRGDAANAVSHYLKALELKPDEAQIHYNLGALFTYLKEYDKAISHYGDALKINSTYPEAHNNIGLLYQYNGDLEKALYHLKESLKYRPHHSATHFNMGNLLSEMKDFKGAIREFETAIQLNPSNTLAMNHIAWIYATNPNPGIRDGEKAVKYAKAACELTQYSDPSLLDTLAAAYAEAGQFENAVNTAKRALAILESSQDANIGKEIQNRMEQYQSKLAFHENF